MKQNISILMDGELCGDDAEVLIGKLKRHPEAQQEWLTYHLIGDVLRQPDYLPNDLGAAFFERLHAEPTVLAPHTKSRSKASFVAMSAVASIMAMTFLAWSAVQNDSGPTLQQARQNSNTVLVASNPMNEGMDDYLLAHQEFSPGSDVRGAASYIRTVAVKNIVAGQ